MIKAFTLIEFLVVLAIVSILIGIILPAYKMLQPSFQLSGAVRTLLTDLRYSQQLTVTEQVNYCLKFFLSEKKYQIIRCGQSNPILEVFLPAEIATFDAVGFTDNQVEFNPYGAVKESGSILLVNTSNKTKTIEVKPSGFVRITD